jgi:hypothetical protein
LVHRCSFPKPNFLAVFLTVETRVCSRERPCETVIEQLAAGKIYLRVFPLRLFYCHSTNASYSFAYYQRGENGPVSGRNSTRLHGFFLPRDKKNPPRLRWYRFQWSSGLRRGSAVLCWLGLLVLTPPGTYACVCLLSVLCVVRQRFLRRPDYSSKGVLPTVVCLNDCE